jgi:hypothetical protein
MNDPEHDPKDPLVDPTASTPEAAPAPFSGQPDDLHDLFAPTPNFTGTDDEDPLAALRNDPNYAALIRDLEYIASQARLLFEPAQEAPPDELWDKIQSKLQPPDPPKESED